MRPSSEYVGYTTADAITWAVFRRAYLPPWTIVKRFKQENVPVTNGTFVHEWVFFIAASMIVIIFWPFVFTARAFRNSMI
jgi:hypothetical protein